MWKANSRNILGNFGTDRLKTANFRARPGVHLGKALRGASVGVRWIHALCFPRRPALGAN